MKTIYTILLTSFLLAWAGSATAQSHIGGVTIHEPRIEKTDEVVSVSFRAEIGRDAVSRKNNLIVGPQIDDGEYSWSLPVIVVQGRKGRLSLERRIMATGNAEIFESAFFAGNGEVVDYFASIPYQEWMEGATLSIEAINAGCCSYSELVAEVMTEGLLLQPAKEEVQPTVREVIVERVLSTGDKLNHSYSFIVPADKYVEIGPGELYDEDREGTIAVSFPVSRYQILPDFGDNRQSLVDLMASIRILENSIDSRVKAVVIAGFASPEGSFQTNDRLAWNRAVAVKEYVLRNSNLDADRIKIYNGAADWQGLRILIDECDQPWRDRALEIIDTTPVWDASRKVGRMGQLMLLDGGNAYRHMNRHMFPKLRQAAYIRVYYENSGPENKNSVNEP